MSDATDPWELLYEKHRELFDKATSRKLSHSERAELTAILAEFHKPTPPAPNTATKVPSGSLSKS